MEIFHHSSQEGVPGTYKEFYIPGSHKVSANLTCPECGHVMSLINHTIQYHGKVTPSVKCPRCSFHDNVELGSWNQVSSPYYFKERK